jgi:hypothetical protein
VEHGENATAPRGRGRLVLVSGVRRRFWLESALAIATAIVAVVTSIWPEWIEAIFGADPDGGSGAAEWAVVGVLATITLALAGAAGREWRRARLATS